MSPKTKSNGSMPEVNLAQSAGNKKTAEQDPSEIDRSGQFVSLFGQGGMLAIAKTPIIKRTLGLPWSERRFCVILTTDGQIQTVTEEEYRQRFRHHKARAR